MVQVKSDLEDLLRRKQIPSRQAPRSGDEKTDDSAVSIAFERVNDCRQRRDQEPSRQSVGETIDKLEGIVTAKGFKVVARIDHAAGAEAAGMDLRPTQLLIFGNPKVGTKLMTSAQAAGLDLPVKVLAYEDAMGQVWIAYNDPGWMLARHDITDRDPVGEKMSKALSAFTDAAASK